MIMFNRCSFINVIYHSPIYYLWSSIISMHTNLSMHMTHITHMT